jgi:DNA-binding transcriptional LysR family regulator
MDNGIDYNAAYTAVKVAENGSFVRASEQLQLPVSTVSARVQALERSLGVKLFLRSTRRVRLTEAGQNFFEHARRGGEAFEDAVRAATQLAEQPRGLLSVIAPALFARHLLPQLLPRFLTRYPDLSLTVDAVNTLPDLVERGADIGIGVGTARGAGYTRRSLVAFSQAVYASPHFVARWGTPMKLEELTARPLLTVGSRPTAAWVLANGSRRQEIKIRARVNVSDVSAVYGLTVAGIGAALLPEPMCQEDLASAKLIRLLPGWATPPVQVSAYYPRRLLEPRKVQLFLDYLIEWFAKPKEL